MKLLDYDKIYFDVLRDGEFESLGLIGKTPPEKSLAYAQSESFLIAACNDPDISCIICSKDLTGNELLINSGKGMAVCTLPKTSFILFHNYLAKNRPEYHTEYKDTQIKDGCRIHPTASIADKGVFIGHNVTVEQFAVINEGSWIGDNAIIHTGAVIGAENYDFSKNADGHIVKMQQMGQTYLANDVEIGCYAVIGRAPFSYETTEIGENTCIESLVTVSHACKIGKDCYIGGKVNICGSVVIEDGARINPMATIKDSVKIGKDAIVSLGSVVANNVPDGKRVTGNFAVEHSKFLSDHLRKLKICRKF